MVLVFGDGNVSTERGSLDQCTSIAVDAVDFTLTHPPRTWRYGEIALNLTAI